MEAENVRAVDIFGHKIHPLRKNELIELVARHVQSKKRLIMAHLNLHGMAKSYESAGMARLFKEPSCIRTVDGMSMIWLSWLVGPRLGRDYRVTSIDYIDDLFTRASAENWKVIYVGGKEEVIQSGLSYFRKRYPGVSLDGRNGYFDMRDFSEGSANADILKRLEENKYDVLIAGMGMPRQEEWVDLIQGKTDVPVIITIGAMMEYFTGALSMPPRWLGPLGMEWLYRLATSPRRVAGRYLVEPFVLAARILARRPH